MAPKRNTRAAARTQRALTRVPKGEMARGPAPEPAAKVLDDQRSAADARFQKVANRPLTFSSNEARDLRLKPNDTLDGVIRDPVAHGKDVVSYIADVGTTHPDYDPNEKRVILQGPQGVYTVPEREILSTYVPPVAEQHRAKRVPGKTFPAGHPANLTGEGR